MEMGKVAETVAACGPLFSFEEPVAQGPLFDLPPQGLRIGVQTPTEKMAAEMPP